MVDSRKNTEGWVFRRKPSDVVRVKYGIHGKTSETIGSVFGKNLISLLAQLCIVFSGIRAGDDRQMPVRIQRTQLLKEGVTDL